ncbi:MAG: hypothetical protein JST75_02315 [Bacteroidetes bacterium]|nr:hypothetical protein [Bacteroidota bacterium]
MNNISKSWLTLSLAGFLWQSSFAQVSGHKTLPASTASMHNMVEKTNTLANNFQGTIFFDQTVLPKMENEWHLNLSQLLGNKIKLELWLADYQPDNKKQGYSIVSLRQRINSAVNFQVTPDNTINYQLNVTNALAGKLVMVVYSPSLSSQQDMKVKGKPNDGTGASITHQYECNAKSVINKNIVYGVYSILPGQTDPSHVDFSFVIPGVKPNCKNCDWLGDVSNFVSDAGDFVKKTINGVEYVFDQTIDGVSGLANCVIKDINGLGDAAGYFINETGQYFYLTAAGLVNLVFYGNIPATRTMREDEYAWANNKIYNHNLPPRERIKIFNFMNPLSQDPLSFQKVHRYYTWPSPTGQEVYMNLGDAFDNPTNMILSNYPFPGQVFIHELGHAWEIYQYGAPGMVDRYIRGGGFGQTYDPGCMINNVNSSFNLEQQATLIDRTYVQVYDFMDAEKNKMDKYNCSNFQLQWVENNVRRGQKFDIGGITATIVMQQHAAGLAAFVGTTNNSYATYTTGTKKDGDGYFMLGSIPWSVLYYNNNTKKAYANWGDIRKKYNSLNSEHGNLGWPQMDPAALQGGAYQKFDNGYIYWTSKYGAFVVEGEIFDAWAKQNWEKGPLGYPVSDYTATSNKMQSLDYGGVQKFEHGFIELQIKKDFRDQSITSANVHIYSKAEESGIVSDHMRNAQLVTAATDSSSASNNFKNLPPRASNQVTPGRIGNPEMINPQPLPPKQKMVSNKITK